MKRRSQWENIVGRVVVVQSETDLLEVVRALGATGGLAGRLHRRKQERDEHGNDGDDHQQLDQREAATG